MNVTKIRFIATALVGCISLLSIARAATIEGYWAFNEPTGTVADDSSANNFDATLINGPVRAQFSPDPLTMSYSTSFDGINDYGAVGNVYTPGGSPAFNNDFSLTAWVRPDVVSGVQRIMGHSAGTGGFAWGLNGSDMIFTTKSATDYISAAANLKANGWTHVGVSFSAGNQATFYVDGVSIGTTGAGGAATGAPTDFRVGMAAFGAVTQYFDGRLDNVKVIKGALTATEMQAEATIPNLVGYYGMDELTGITVATDSSGYHATSPNRDGIIQAGVSRGQTAPKDKFGTSMFFPGNVGTSRVDMSGTTAYGSLVNNAFTVAAWIRPTDLAADVNQRVFSSGLGAGGWGFGIADGADVGTAADDLIFTTYGFTDYRIDASLIQGEWAHIAAVYNPLGSVSFYVNGTLLGTVGGGGNTTAAASSASLFSIGVLPAVGQFFRGGIDELRVYDRGLTASEIAALVPEPASVTLLLLGFAGLARMRRTRLV